MNISNILNVNSPAIADAAKRASTAVPEDDGGFSSILKSAMGNLQETNALLNDEEQEEIKFALGISENTHDLAIASAKASTALSYTVALRDRFIEAYRELIQIQV